MRTSSTLSIVLLSAALLFRCDRTASMENGLSGNQKGSLVFSLEKRTIPSEVKVVIAKLERRGYRSFVDSVFVSGAIDSVKPRFGDIPPGLWLLRVQAKDSRGIVRYAGTENVKVVKGRTTQTVVYMTPTPRGDVEITLVWGKSRLKWKMSAENPVLSQASGSWDGDHFFFDDPFVLKVDGIYYMWYVTGYNASGGHEDAFWIAHATSIDGIHWTKHGPVIHPGPPGSWMEKGADGPSVIYENGVFRMWFEGHSSGRYHNGIGYATSTDGKFWAVNYQPVVTTNSSRPTMWHPCVMRKDALYYLYFGVSSSASLSPGDIYVMTSTDGDNWIDRGRALTARRNLSWEASGIDAPHVIYDDNKFIMLYTGFSPNSGAIGVAESFDGFTWFGTSDLPTLTATDTSPWRTTLVGYCSALKDNGKLKVWISGLVTQPTRYQIGFAEQIQ